MSGIDVLVVSAGNTSGWRAAADELTASITRAGVHAELVAAQPSAPVRTFAATDYIQARAARRAAAAGIAQHAPRSIVYCSVTAALLWPAPGAIWLDSLAADNRPGRHGIWQRPLERRRLAAAPVVAGWSERALDGLRGRPPEMLIVRVPIDAPSGAQGARDVAAVTYAGDPVKRRLRLVLDAWARVRRDGETLIVAGLAAGSEHAAPAPGVQYAGALDGDAFRALLCRARAFIAAPRREDYGIAALEALACGAMLVTTLSPGPYPALALARALDPRLAGEDIGGALRTALDDPAPAYGSQAAELLEPFTRDAVDRVVAGELLPRLLERR